MCLVRVPFDMGRDRGNLGVSASLRTHVLLVQGKGYIPRVLANLLA